jgi:putative Mg2+ transporter-C (MgtC) family protein
VEQHIRTLLLQAVAREALVLKALRSEDIAGSSHVQVQADVSVSGRSDKVVEDIISRLSLEPGIRAMSWELTGPNGKDQI